MSPLSSKKLSIVLCPDQVALLHLRRKLTLRGMERELLGSETLHAENGGDTPWGGALDALGAALPRFAGHNAQANVILSNHFVHYVLVPWCENLDNEEEQAYAVHCFKEVYGDAVDGWEIRISPNSAGLPALASAVDGALLGRLRGLLEEQGLVVKSIQPHLMLAFNSCRTRLHGCNAWFAMLEPGSLCLGALRDGQFVWMRKMRIGQAWQDELPMLLEREAYLADVGLDTNEVLLWAPQLEGEEIREAGLWNIRQLNPGSMYGHALQTSGQYSDGGVA